jgi:tRNA threonylcarbamoyladenosine biosynthesis protein TsaB
MNLLAFDTSTEIMSIAVQRAAPAPGAATGMNQVWQHNGPGGAQTSANLIPNIQRLMAQAKLQFEELDAILFGSGPGSFTGLRTACSVAQGLAFAANLRVLPIDTLLAVAEEARYQHGADLTHYQVTALLDARMDEMYAASYEFSSGLWKKIGSYSLIHPEDLVCATASTLAGNVFATYGARLPAAWRWRVDALPDARAMLRLAPDLLAAGQAVRAEQALPLYIRDKVAKTTAERAAEKAAA